MLVPFATGPSHAAAQAPRTLQLPHLRRLLRRLAPAGSDPGTPDSLSMPHERALARAGGLAPTDGQIPLAALALRRAGADPAGQACAWIAPAHWRVGQDHIEMRHPQDLQLAEPESRALLAAMQPYFQEDGIALEYESPERWLARGEIFRALPTASLDRVIGRRIEDAWMPSGPSGRTVRRLQQEMQMLLYTLPLNDERQARGLLPVNTFWVSGAGALPPGPTARADEDLRVATTLRDAALRGDVQAWACAWQQLDAGDCARLLADAERGAPVRVTLCGEASARTWASTPASGWRRLTALLAPLPPLPSLLEGL